MESWERYTVCAFCDGGCAIKATMQDGRMRLEPADPALPAICPKTRMIDEYRLHPDRVTRPLKNVGTRGEPMWEPISWDQALDEIADRLKRVISQYGPTSVAFCETPLNHGFGGITRRLMNRIGTPNYTAPTQLCMGNTAQVHRAVYGWLAVSNWNAADVIVYFGQNRGPELWPAEFCKLKAALARGAKLIVVDPRATATTALADYHLRIRYGTDAALALGWLNVIVEEELYDRDFVASNCIGFDELRERVREYPPETVAEICGISADAIRETARVYAGAEAAIIPWGATCDMQSNSTSVLQAQCIMRAICGYLNVSETVFGPALGGASVSVLADHASLGREARDAQLGADAHPLLTFRAAELYDAANERAGIPYVPDIMAESVACVPPALFAAMRGEGPYPVKATFAVANNTVMSYAGQQGIVEGFLNQDLVVVFDHWITPTAQLADYVLPGDMWAERDALRPQYDVAPLFTACQQLVEPVGECKDWYFVVKGLADRLGFGDSFPWADRYELFDYQLAELGSSWEKACEVAPKPVMRKAVCLGSFVTPSGKVELASLVLATLGFDPLPAYIEPADPGADGGDFPYVAFAGSRDAATYNTNLHQIQSLRKTLPEPLAFVNPTDAEREGVAEGDWCVVESAYGSVQLMAHLDDAQPEGTVRIPHGWWKPEQPAGIAAGLGKAMLHNDGMLFPDEDWNLDPAQGLPNLRGGIHVRFARV